MKKKGLLAFLLALGIVLVVYGLFVWRNSTDNTTTKEEAITQAKEYRPTEMCVQVVTPATHTETGAKYTFGSGCLPPGWEADQ